MDIRRAIAGALIGATVTLAAVASAQGGDRAQVMNRIIDGINSPDPVTRMITLEQAMATKDKNLQRIALSAAFASSDLALRTSAIEAVFRTKSSFIVEFTGLAQGTSNRVVWENSGGRMEVWVESLDAQSGDFRTRSNYSFWDITKKVWTMAPGNLSGDRLSFTVNVYSLGAGIRECSAVIVAGDASAIMTGTMSCSVGTIKAAYTVKVDLLR